ncbi:hypothetical protein E2320_016450 [Naja naja]|nr:hypothetical protein E2320_016450 [Naja naja]
MEKAEKITVYINEAKVFTKCELASILKGKGMDGYHGYSLGNWICMAYHESRYNSRAVGPRNSDGSRDYGIFQINSRYWCKNNQGPTANGCNKPCSAFTNDDIKDDIECAKRIVRDPQKMGAWFSFGVWYQVGAGLPGGTTAKEEICHNGLVAAGSEMDDPVFLFLLLGASFSSCEYKIL